MTERFETTGRNQSTGDSETERLRTEVITDLLKERKGEWSDAVAMLLVDSIISREKGPLVRFLDEASRLQSPSHPNRLNETELIQAEVLASVAQWGIARQDFQVE